MPSDNEKITQQNKYEKITQQNKIDYGIKDKHLEHYEKQYRDKTHFLFELIQNAEDESAEWIDFKIFFDKIEIRHNAPKKFDDVDVKGICGVNEGNKTGKKNKIGRFGIGFKSVYAYTDCPEIYSGDESFKIEKYIFPKAIENINLLNDDTLFVLPFNKSLEDFNDLFENLKKKLRTLGLNTLMFLNHLKKITWKINDEDNGLYTKKVTKSKSVDNVKIEEIELSLKSGTIEIRESWYLLKTTIINGEKEFNLAVSYKNNNGIFIPIKESESLLSVYLPTTIKLGLKYLINGNYNSIPSREGIYQTVLKLGSLRVN